MKARYDGQCSMCGKAISVGDLITMGMSTQRYGERRSRWAHVSCASGSASPARKGPSRRRTQNTKPSTYQAFTAHRGIQTSVELKTDLNRKSTRRRAKSQNTKPKTHQKKTGNSKCRPAQSSRANNATLMVVEGDDWWSQQDRSVGLQFPSVPSPTKRTVLTKKTESTQKKRNKQNRGGQQKQPRWSGLREEAKQSSSTSPSTRSTGSRSTTALTRDPIIPTQDMELEWQGNSGRVTSIERSGICLVVNETFRCVVKWGEKVAKDGKYGPLTKQS
jgi:hypothetical protein